MSPIRGSARIAISIALAAGMATTAARAQPFDYERDFSQFAADVSARRGIDEDRIRAILREARFLEPVIKAMSRPAERKPWYAYRKIFLTDSRIAGGAEFWARHRVDLDRAAAEFGVPAHVVVAIIGVETLYGRRKGNIRVLDSLATLGFRYPRRAEFFRKELEQYLMLTGEERLDPLKINGSYAGAMGIPQFISSSYRRYAVDFDGDGVRDLLNNPVDAIGSVASYLAEHGWRRGEPIATRAGGDGAGIERFAENGLKPTVAASEMRAAGVSFEADELGDRAVSLLEFELDSGKMEYWGTLRNFYAITRYNHSKLYALAVFELAGAIRSRYEAASG